MSQTKYLIVGSSHAGLSALEAIRIQDEEEKITYRLRVHNKRSKLGEKSRRI